MTSPGLPWGWLKMTTSNFMIGPIPEGLTKNVKPFAIAENAFAQLTNAYQWRGRVIRKPGYTLLGRLTNNTPVMGLKTRELFGLGLQDLIAFDTTNAYFYNEAGNTFTALPSVMPTIWSGADYQFFYTENYAGAFWAINSKSGLHGYIITNFTNQAGAGPWTVDVTAPGNNFVLGDIIYLLNVTGAPAGNNLIFGTVTIAGNPTFQVTATVGGPFTNGVPTTGIVLSSTRSKTGQDGIRYYGTLSNGTGWANYNPPIDPNNALAGALLIFAYRGYLVFLNTTEGNEAGVQNFGNRARWTQIGTPYYSQPVPTAPNLQFVDNQTARDDLFGRGGANDAPTQEIIIGAAFIRDVLIVYFERSSWRLRFVNNAQNPFVWERINVELGSSSTFSVIPFDKGAMTIGNRGILICDGNDTVRFDEKIPDEVFQIRESNRGFQRVYGIRTFRTRLCYWTIPDASFISSGAGSEGLGVYPNKILVFNYETKNWSYFDDCFTCFGYYYPGGVTLGKRWIDLPEPWPTYNNFTSEIGAKHTGLETVIAGNQQGFVFSLEQGNSQNEPSLYISAIAANILSSPSNNLENGTWIKLTGVTGTTSADGVSLNNRNFKISNDGVNPNDFILNEFEPIDGGLTTLIGYSGVINYIPILKGSVQIDVGAIQFKDFALDGILTSNVAGTVGTINYKTGAISLTFSPALGTPTAVFIRVVSVDPEQDINPVDLTGVYGGGGLITKISNYDIQSKIFNFFGGDSGTRLKMIDFYTDLTEAGQFTVDILGDSSNIPMNKPLADNPQSNVVLTSKNPYQVGSGDQTIFRLWAHASSQTYQIKMYLSDRQMAVDAINDEDFELLAMMVSVSDRGRIV